MKLTLNVWRQKDRRANGSFEKYTLDGVSEHMSFLEMLDVLNEKLQTEGKMEKATGKVESAVGGAKDAIRDASR